MKTRSMVITGPRKMALWEFDIPPIGPEDGLLAVEMVGICGSDVGIYKGKQTDYPPPYPLILGHEIVGRFDCVIFNIGGNKYRLVTRILYPSQKVFILKVMTHKEYDQDKWKKECGCFAPPRKAINEMMIHSNEKKIRKRIKYGHENRMFTQRQGPG